MPRVDLARRERAELKKRGREYGVELAEEGWAALVPVADRLTDEFCDEIGRIKSRQLDHVCNGLLSERIKPAVVRQFRRAAQASFRERLAGHAVASLAAATEIMEAVDGRD